MIFPFTTLYLNDNLGLSGTEVGLIVTVAPIVGLAAPTLWGRIADRSGRGSLVLAIATIGAATTTALLAAANDFASFAIGMAFQAVFTTGVLPLAVSVSLATLGFEASERFGRVRVWGTVGFFLLVVSFPPALHVLQRVLGLERGPGRPAEPGLEVMFLVTAALVFCSTVAALRIPEARPVVPTASPAVGWRDLRAQPSFRRILAFGFLASLFIAGPMSLFPVYVRSRGGGLDDLSHMWIFMLATEIPLIAYAGGTLRRLGPRGLLAAGLVAGGVRWLVCGLTADLRVIYPVQALHGALVAWLSIGGPLYVEAVVPPALRATGQGLYFMAGGGFGTIVSCVIAGWLMDHAGASTPYVIGGAGALVLAGATPLLLPPPRRPDPGEKGL